MDEGFYDLINDLIANGMTTDDIASQFTNTLNAINEDRRAKSEAAAKAKRFREEKISAFMELWADICGFLVEYDYIDESEYNKAVDLDRDDAAKMIDELDESLDAVRMLAELLDEDLGANPLWKKKAEPVKKDAESPAVTDNKEDIKPAVKLYGPGNIPITVKQLTPEEAQAKANEIQEDIKKINDKINENMKKFPKMRIHLPSEEDFLKTLQKFLGNT